MNKKGSIGLVVVAVILALVILGVFLVSIASRDCNANKDCAENSYCGSDYECHQYPDEIVVTENNYVPAAIILSFGLMLAAYIFRTGKVPFFKR